MTYCIHLKLYTLKTYSGNFKLQNVKNPLDYFPKVSFMLEYDWVQGRSLDCLLVPVHILTSKFIFV